MPKAFISYTWHGDEHRAWVRKLAECLRGGGEIVVAGTPEDVAREKRSYTGQYLKEALKRGRKEAAE